MEEINSPGKKERVEAMFNAISRRYDLLNHLLSFGIDRRWRRKLIARLPAGSKVRVLDVATGTGDLAIAAARHTGAHITATDIAWKMMEQGEKKVLRLGLQNHITFIQADAEALPFEDKTFDALMVAFGVRNFEHLDKGLHEFFRVLKPGSKVLVLEFSMPRNIMIRALYRLYFGRILPVIGKLVSRHPDAYRYLPESVDLFPYGDAFLDHLQKAGFVQSGHWTLSGGIAMLYEGIA
jgi:demethylmenaquinone methyltransferase / 2-methoxy-6-polyprenyl-1,4-benzoquinol methylase